MSPTCTLANTILPSKTDSDRRLSYDCVPPSLDSKTEQYNSTAAYGASLSHHGTATKRSENATSSCSTARAHITTPTASVSNAHNGYIPPYVPDMSFQLYSQLSGYAQSSVFLVTVVIIAIILLFFANSIALPSCN